MQPARERLDATVHGRVQGVGYRVFALREAMDLGRRRVGRQRGGRQRPRHRRRAEAQTSRTLLARLEAGPPAAIVDRVAARWEPARGAATGFRIESRAHRGD